MADLGATLRTPSVVPMHSQMHVTAGLMSYEILPDMLPLANTRQHGSRPYAERYETSLQPEVSPSTIHTLNQRYDTRGARLSR